MPALFRSYNTRRTLICMSAAALLWGSSPAMSTPAHAARYHKLPELTSSGPVAADSKEAAAAARKGLYEQMSAATGIPWFRFAAIDQYERSVAKKKKALRRQKQTLQQLPPGSPVSPSLHPYGPDP